MDSCYCSSGEADEKMVTFVQEGRYTTEGGDFVHAKFYIQINAGTISVQLIAVVGFPFHFSTNTTTLLDQDGYNSSASDITSEIKVCDNDKQIVTTAEFYSQAGVKILHGYNFWSATVQQWL